MEQKSAQYIVTKVCLLRFRRAIQQCILLKIQIYCRYEKVDVGTYLQSEYIYIASKTTENWKTAQIFT